MLFKWIVCKVQPDNRKQFSVSQEAWSSLASVNGFIAQFGGWDLKNDGDACILGIWQDKASYDYFMTEVHDEIFEANSQKSTYEEIATELFNVEMDMIGEKGNLVEALESGNYLRVADCIVKPENEEHFVNAQKDVWVPAMSDAKGMIGGNFSKSLNDSRYIVTTLWSEKELHDSYSQKVVPVMREQANVSDDLKSMIGRLVKLESSWSVG